MEAVSSVSLQDIANILVFIGPGYLAITIYALKYAKSERSFSKLVVESIVLSLFFIAAANFVWITLLNHHTPETVNTEYTTILLMIAALAGLIFTELRVRWPIKQMADKLGLGSPDEDFMRSHFSKLAQNDPVTVVLKSGTTFSGTPVRGSIYSKNGSRKYRFDYVAWLNNKSKDGWDVTDECVIVDLKEVEYIVSPRIKPSKDTH